MGEEVLQRPACPSPPQHGDDRVVTGHRANDPGQRGLIDAASDQVRGARRSPDHRHRVDKLDGQDQLPDQRSRASVAADRTDQPQLLDVTRDGGLGGAKTAPRKRLGELLLRVHPTAVDEREDRLVPLTLGRGHLRTCSIVDCARSTSAAVMISGGTKRIELSSTAFTMSPASRQDCWNTLARGSANSNACIRPMPRTSFTSSSSRAACSRSPISEACPTRPSRSITESTDSAAMHERGFPPK